jgi:hypothetical protein
MTQAAKRTRHGRGLSPQSLPPAKIAPYPDVVPDSSDIRRLRVDDDTWDAYTEIVGERGRSADLKAYINWRIDNPTAPLPGRRRGPVRKVGPAKPPAES